jgi:hypothetical protein
MSGKERKTGPDKGAKGTAAEAARRRREAEQLRANLLKRKEQSRSRAQPDDAAPLPGKDPATG